MADRIREQIDERFKWKVSDIIESDEAWQQAFEEVEAKIPAVAACQGKLGTKEGFAAYCRADEDLGILLGKVYLYAHMQKDADGTNTKYVGMMGNVMGLLVRVSQASAYVAPELSALPEEQLNAYISDPDFAAYDKMLKGVLKNKPHILSESEEALLASMGSMNTSYREIFHALDDVDFPFPTVKDPDGNDFKITHSGYSVALQSTDAAFRERAFKAYYEGYKGLINTITSIYTSGVQKDVCFARARKFNSCLEKALFYEEVSPEVYKTLLSTVEKNTRYLHEYMALRKKIIGADVMHVWDLHFPIFKNADMKLDYDDAFALVMEGLAPLGEEYVGLLKYAKDNRWIDVYENRGKRAGAYSTGVFGVHPYVLLNHELTTHATFTLAHEMGHCLHTYYSNANQPYAKADYTIFVAEVASTVNEVLLLKHILAKTQDINMKKFLLSYYLDMFRTTLFRQTQFAEFEAKAHEMAETNQPMTVDTLSDFYGELNYRYYGDAVNRDEDIRYEWARIPHFYNAFYVYKYATGITSAINIASMILKEGQPAVDRYKAFLKSGGSDTPVELLKIAGVNLETEAPFNYAMQEFKAALDELTELTK